MDENSLAQILREDLADFRTEVRALVQGMVTKDAFEAEKRYRTEQHRQLVDRLNASDAARASQKRWTWGAIITLATTFMLVAATIVTAYIHH